MSPPGFSPRSDTLAVIAEICRRLDGLPLAIELAAARMRVLRPASLLERIDATALRRWSVLRSRSRDVDARHRDLRATIGWSHDLLAPATATLFREMSVFRERCTVEAIEAICGDEHGGLLDALAEFVDLHLVEPVNSDDIDSFRMLTTVREVARNLLETSGKADVLAARHAVTTRIWPGRPRSGWRRATSTWAGSSTAAGGRLGGGRPRESSGRRCRT